MHHTITVAGGGSWGTALAHLLASRGHSTCLWLRDAAVAEAVNSRHENPRYLPGLALHPSLSAGTDPGLLDSEILLLAIPCQQLRGWLRAMRGHLHAAPVLVNAAKGLELGSLAPCSRIVAEELAGRPFHYAMLSGPSFAAEVVRNQPTAVVLATEDHALGCLLRELFSSAAFRCYSSTDVTGVELGGALKNVMAIAAGVCDGLGLGHNSRAALMTRGLAEMSRIGEACGAQAATFMGLSGLGDLALTCTGDLSRNRQVGLRLGRGEALEHITASLGMVAEGVKTTAAVHELARRLGVEAPVTETVQSLLHGGESPRDAVMRLMTRTLRRE
ncbi:NAD(P)H-dependent glycerol-3-phosphate dehydrogenase [uncultured Desulfovibrio sp.]|uniref:NAD(P)H-dependent glycerol-3-phosphate dehydrogenase n=1 Tax=uncultured Desulfovibrio sp. TaxID=167968 RepID=UPI002602F136|nr:NAD(P)H-dependent glycerol-3-phosphate dehydrogenase [uncultured Desulfovibrio sp.]